MTNTSQVMEINSLNSSIVKKEVSSSPLPSPRGLSEPPDEERPSDGDMAMADCAYTTRILQLKRDQQVQQQLLLHQYQQQQLQLAEQHEKELQHHIKYLEQQTARAEEERQEKHRQQEMDRLQAIKKKSKEEQSAVASTEVKQLLQDLIRKKQAAAQAAQGGNGSTNTLAYPRNCHPYRPSPGPHSHDDFPLRKTD